MPALLRGPGAPPGAAAAHGRGAAGGAALAERLAGLPAAERRRVLLDLVRAQVAAVLGHASADAVDAGRGRSRTWASTR